MIAGARWWRDPVRRGFLLLCLSIGALGFALSAQQTIVANYFVEVLHLDGPQFGYITAVREVPGFLLIFLVALLYRLSLPHLSALALCLVTVGYALFPTATSFWTVAPWVIISSFGYHTLLQTQYALAMSLTTEHRSGTLMGQVGSMWSYGGVVALVLIGAGFWLKVLDFNATFLIAAAVAFAGAVAMFYVPVLRDGKVEARPAEREPIVFRREYGWFYLLRFLDGARMQVFFSFGVWVLVAHYQMDVWQISVLSIASSAATALATPWVGRMLDRYGERAVLGVTNVIYVVILAAYGLIDNLPIAVACYIVYMAIMQLAEMGSALYIRKIAPHEDVAPSLAMGLSVAHAAAIVVPVLAGYLLNFVGYQVPFLIACGLASLTFLVTRQLNAERQKSARRLALEQAQAATAD